MCYPPHPTRQGPYGPSDPFQTTVGGGNNGIPSSEGMNGPSNEPGSGANGGGVTRVRLVQFQVPRDTVFSVDLSNAIAVKKFSL